MSRIDQRFQLLKQQQRTALIPFIMASDPDHNTSQTVLDGLPAAGADLIEIGMPFSDPMADGPVIQMAGNRALKAGGSIKHTLNMVRQFRKQDNDTPIILMGYYNPIYHYGREAFCRDATQAGVDGLIIVDLPPEEEGELKAYSNTLDLVRLIAPPSIPDRLPLLAESASGFVYYISVSGITGAASANEDSIRESVAQIRRHTALPIAVGFGIKTPEQAAMVANHADAVVVGSALVKVMEEAQQNGENVAEAAHAFVTSLAGALS